MTGSSPTAKPNGTVSATCSAPRPPKRAPELEGDPMSKLLVIELPEETNLTEAIQALNAVQATIGLSIGRCRVFAAIREDADAVLRVFNAASPDPDPQETP